MWVRASEAVQRSKFLGAPPSRLMPHIICFHAIPGTAGVSPADRFLYQFPGKIGDLSPLFSFSDKEPPRRRRSQVPIIMKPSIVGQPLQPAHCKWGHHRNTKLLKPWDPAERDGG
jgi:hypothetical protein